MAGWCCAARCRPSFRGAPCLHRSLLHCGQVPSTAPLRVGCARAACLPTQAAALRHSSSTAAPSLRSLWSASAGAARVLRPPPGVQVRLIWWAFACLGTGYGVPFHAVQGLRETATSRHPAPAREGPSCPRLRFRCFTSPSCPLCWPQAGHRGRRLHPPPRIASRVLLVHCTCIGRRQGIVGAASIHHLCKSIVIENTRAHPSGESS